MKNEMHPEGVRERADARALWHPFGVRIINRSDIGGLHCAPTSGYFRATLRVASQDRHSFSRCVKTFSISAVSH